MSNATTARLANYTLIANGSATCPQMEIAIYCSNDADAKTRACEMAEAMNGSSFYRFTLYRTLVDGSPHVHLGQVELEVKITTKFKAPRS